MPKVSHIWWRGCGSVGGGVFLEEEGYISVGGGVFSQEEGYISRRTIPLVRRTVHLVLESPSAPVLGLQFYHINVLTSVTMHLHFFNGHPDN